MFFYLINAAEELERLIVKEPTRLGQLQRAAAAIQQLHAKFGLKVLNLTAERGLSDMKLFGGAAEIPRPGDRSEVAELTQFHPCFSSIIQPLGKGFGVGTGYMQIPHYAFKV